MLHRIIKRNPAVAYYTDGGLTMLHHLCGFGSPTKESIAILLQHNPAALIDPTFKLTPLQLLGHYDIVIFLIAVNRLKVSPSLLRFFSVIMVMTNTTSIN